MLQEECFYIVWVAAMNKKMGNTCLRQYGNGSGLDLAAAHIWLMKNMNEPCIIVQWQQMSRTQYDRFRAFVDELAKQGGPRKEATILKLHKGGEDGKESGRDEKGPGQAGPESIEHTLDHGDSQGADLRKEEVRSPQLAPGDQPEPPPGGCA